MNLGYRRMEAAPPPPSLVRRVRAGKVSATVYKKRKLIRR